MSSIVTHKFQNGTCAAFVKFTTGVDVLQVLCDGWTFCPEKVGDLLLGEPNRILLNSHFQSNRIVRLIKHNFVFFSCFHNTSSFAPQRCINGSLPPRSARGRLVPPRDDAKRQWGQSPEIEDSTESKDDPTTPRYAMSGFHIETGGFLYAAAIDARQRRHDMAAGTTQKKL